MRRRSSGIHTPQAIRMTISDRGKLRRSLALN
jgi:hypothetical protein